MDRGTAPFSRFEFMIAWRYLRARRAEGGVSTMTWISFLGITLAVMALIATLAVRSGFRHEFVGTILGANAHITLAAPSRINDAGQVVRDLTGFEEMADAVAGVDGVVHAAPVVQGQVLATHGGRNNFAQVVGITVEDLQEVPLVASPEQFADGDLRRLNEGVAVGYYIARNLGLGVGDTIRIISPEGAQTPFGRSPRTGNYEIVYVFRVGRYDIDNTRIYMPFTEAQSFFNRDGVADAVEVTVEEPEEVLSYHPAISAVLTQPVWYETWMDSAGAFLTALQMEDNIMFVILSILVMIATMNIVSGLIMLVKNKSSDIGILRTMGLSEGSILRVFFICGSSIGIAGTAMGVILGCAFAIWIDPIFDFVNWVAGGGVWDPSVRVISELPARLEMGDVMSAVTLSLGLSFIITIFPARRAARMNPVEALRHE